jgi:23S rRNA (adenine2503-C2)-methyltransferase
MVMKILCGLTSDEIFDLIEPYGYSRKNALAVSNGLYKSGVTDFSCFKGVPKELKNLLGSQAVTGIISPLRTDISSDKSIKYLFRTNSGKEYETVFIPENKRTTVCVSTQSGCRIGCTYCATARYGFHGDLTAGEIVNQVVALNSGRQVTHVVFMGMGEPMDNLDNVLKACEILTSEWGLAISKRNITVSTVGLTPGVRKFLECSACNLTLSLHSPFSEERALITPAEKIYPVNEIIEIMKEYTPGKKRRLSVAYVMIKNRNDTDAHLEELIKLFKGSEIRINLLPYHPIPADSNISSGNERMEYFKQNLVTSGISASIRKSRGTDICAACGLLATGLDCKTKEDINQGY